MPALFFSPVLTNGGIVIHNKGHEMENTGNPIRTLRVAAVQVESQPGRIAANHAHALPFIKEAVADGAQLVVLPELFACGYVPNADIWRYGETINGPTVSWLRSTSQRYGIFLGAGLLEIENDDFFNSFALTSPGGELLGCARKTRAEVYCFRYGAGRHVIRTDLGIMGIGICADNHFSDFPGAMHQSDVDLMLMPHGSPMPYKTSNVISENDIVETVEKALSVPGLYTDSLGIPAVFVNAVGTLQPMAGLLGKFITPETFRLRGFSRIVDSDGTVIARLGEEEGLIVGNITLDPSRKTFRTPPDHGGWLHRGSWMTRNVLMPVDLAVGRLSYAVSRKRRRAARTSVAEKIL
ncbi:MAG: carbon-nitrogen hydrolase family protein [Spirochaetaceae bacterium]|nr:MAG: carbon-nitrogen hydrolase family protein [Spirochaetaceae bacterium]